MTQTAPRVFTALFLSAALAGLGVLALARKPKTPMPAPTPAAPLAAVAADAGVRKIAAANTAFGFGMLRRLAQGTPGGNVFFSPFSVSSALSLTQSGAGGAARQSIASALALTGLTRDGIDRANGLLLPSLRSPDPKVQISVANALWANEGFAFAPDFQTRARRFYDAQAQTVDLGSGSPQGAETINAWVGEHTHGRITKLVTPQDLLGSAAVLTNAVYFHGLWRTPFEKEDTRDGAFTLASGGKKTVPLMSRSGLVSYSETAQFQAASLPYGAGRVRFYVFLPKPGTGVDALVGGLSAQTWQGWIGAMKPTEIRLFLPRFQADYQATLNGPLMGMGMGPAFRAGADFAPMGLPGGFLGAVIHKAVLDVDEEGTTAAAATAVVMPRSIRPAPTTVMRVDRPFFCAIRDNATGTLLFVGVIRDPQ